MKRPYVAGPFALLALLVAGQPALAEVQECSAPVVDPSTGLPFGELERAGSRSAASGVISIVGWALDDDGIQRVEVLVDGTVQTSTKPSRGRPDIEALFGEFPGAATAGWVAFLNSARFPNGLHTITARGVSKSGEVAVLTATRVVQFGNSVHNLVPFGHIDVPADNTQLFGTCNPATLQRRLTVVMGWALDVGIETNDHGIGYVELLIDGTISANSRLNCRTDPLSGVFTDCYGVRREDVERRYPDLKDSPHSGFRFVMDIGALIAGGYAEGHHILSIRAGDRDSQVAEIDSIAVTFRCEDALPDPGSFGAIDGITQSSEFVSGVINITGWALDKDGVQSVRVFIDGAGKDAAFGFARPDVALLYPGFPDTTMAGWLLAVDTTLLSNGVHRVNAVVTDDDGNETTIAKRTFRVLNP